MAPKPIIPLRTYDLKLVQFVLDGTDISGYEEDGGLEWESGSDIAVPKVGATGAAVASRMNDHSGILTVTVGEWTQSYGELARIMQEQQALEGAYEPLDFLMYDQLNGDRFTDEWCVIMQRPTPNKQKEAGERVFALFFPNVFHPQNSKWGANNLPQT